MNQLAPTTDPGRFDLRVGSTVVRPAAGDGGTGSLAVAAGTYTVGEAPASGTDPANYTSSIACTKNGNPDVSGPGTSVDVTVASGDVEVCTTSNQRAARLTLRERLEPATDTGRFDLFAGPTLWAFAVADGGYNTAPIAVGTYTLSETAESGRLGDYVSSIACQLNGKPGPAGSGTSLHVTITYGDVLDCTFTNVLGPRIIVKKVLSPTRTRAGSTCSSARRSSRPRPATGARVRHASSPVRTRSARPVRTGPTSRATRARSPARRTAVPTSPAPARASA